MSQWIPNSFQLPNALVDSGVLARLKGPALAMYIFIVRKTRGWQKDSDAISISQFVEFTGYGKDAVLSGADKLVEIGLIQRIEYQNQPALYILNDLPEVQSEITTAEKPHAEITTGGVGKTDKLQSEITTHNNKHKTTIKNNIHTVFEFWKETFGKTGKVLLSSKRSSKIEARLKQGYSVEDIKRAIVNCSKSDYHVQNNHIDLELICRDEQKLDRFIEMTAGQSQQAGSNAANRNVNDAWANKPQFAGNVEHIEIPEDFV